MGSPNMGRVLMGCGTGPLRKPTRCFGRDCRYPLVELKDVASQSLIVGASKTQWETSYWLATTQKMNSTKTGVSTTKERKALEAQKRNKRKALSCTSGDSPLTWLLIFLWRELNISICIAKMTGMVIRPAMLYGQETTTPTLYKLETEMI